MRTHWIRLCGAGLAALIVAPGAHAADGLVAPAAETLWPRWQARIAVQAASVSPLSVSAGLLAGSAVQHGVQGAALFGDYYFARPSFGGFRASGGLLSGSIGGLPLVQTSTAGSQLGVSLSTLPHPAHAAGADSAAALPYLGLGFSGTPWRNGPALSADLGLVAERPSAALGVGRAVFGNQAMDSALRELRLSPVLQLGVRYIF